MPESASKAVFLSYASQDAVAARRICDGLRAVGVEVWFDQSELVGGDAWDAKIRKQIRECALFLPIISAATQARREGYFRLEWKLAALRTHMMADGTPFLLPAVIDATRDTDALVPEEFRDVQWTRLPGGETPPAFAQRVRRLCDEPGAVTAGPGSREPAPSRSDRPAPRPPLSPPSEPPPPVPPFRFASRTYVSPAQLATGLVQRWPEATSRWVDGSILAWARQHRGDEDMIRTLEDIAQARDLAGGQQLAVALLVLNPNLPLIWQGEVVTDAWLAARPELAGKLCDSAVPGWLKRLRADNWLGERAAHRTAVLKEMPATGLPVDRALIDRYVFGPVDVVAEEVRTLVAQCSGARDPAIDALLKQEELSLAEAVTLLAVPRETYLGPGGRMAQREGTGGGGNEPEGAAREALPDEGQDHALEKHPGETEDTRSAAPVAVAANVEREYFAELRSLEGHDGPVHAVTFSAGLRWLVSGGHDCRIVVWDPHTGLELRHMAGVAAAVRCVVFSPDGRSLASAGADAVIRLWEVNIGRELRRLEGHKGPVNSVAFSPNGRQLASGGSDNLVILWDVWSGKEIRRLRGHDDWISGVAFGPDGRWVASSSADNSVRLWDAESGRELRRFDGHAGAVHAVAFDPAGKCLASGGADHTVRLWEPTTGRELRQLTGPPRPVHCVAFSPGKPWLAGGSADQTLRLWDVASGRELQRLEAHTNVVRCLAFSCDGRWLVSGSSDHSVRIWSLITGAALRPGGGGTGSGPGP